MKISISYRSWIIVIFLIFLRLNGFGQTHKLANSYYMNGEYEKAAELYLKMYRQSSKSTVYFNRYIQSLMLAEQYEKAEKAIRKELKRHPDRKSLYVTLGGLLEKRGDEKEAKKWFRKAIDEMSSSYSAISRLANAFISQRKTDLAIDVYRKGEKLLNKPNYFAYNIANLYRSTGDKPGMIRAYLDYLDFQPKSLAQVKQNFSRYLDEEDLDDLEMELYTRLQDHPESILYPRILEWLYVRRGLYDKALEQATALDRRTNGNGQDVYLLGKIAETEKQYDAALHSYAYITEEKGKGNPYYIDAKIASMDTRRKAITDDPMYRIEDLDTLESEYERFIEEQGINGRTAQFVLDLVDLQTFYMHKYKRPVELLEKFIQYQGLDRRLLAKAKLKLADLYLIEGNRWDATLLYSQVDKAFKEAPLGEDARYKNALLAYFFGDFDWAQEQFDILKRATSRMISNDAIDRSVFIMENTGLDSSYTTMKRFSRAELMLFQKKHDEAIAMLDSIMEENPKHELADDALFVKAKIYEDLRQYDKAEQYYLQLVKQFPDAIRTDNAMFQLARMYDRILDNPEKAIEWYEKIFVDHPDSTFAITARKRYRELRGDAL